jgi:hypothetical protein
VKSDLFEGVSADERLAADRDTTLDLPSRRAADLSDLPSVMAGDSGAMAAVTGGEGSGVRYLVVPERIARQADTSFTTPAAPDAAAQAKATPQPDRESAAAEIPATAAPATAAPATVAPATGKPANPKPAPGGQIRQPAARGPQGQATASSRQLPQQSARPQPMPPKTTGQPAAAGRQPTGPRAWGGMFPNVQAGLEAMGSWRSGGRPQAEQSDRGSTRR